MKAANGTAAMEAKDISEPVVAPQPAWRRYMPVWGTGLLALLVGAGVALAIALPVTMKQGQQSRSGAAVQLSPSGVDKLQGTTRTFYLAADPIDWDYTPLGRDVCKGRNFSEEQQGWVSEDVVGRVFKKAAYREYTDASFKTPKERIAADEHLGLLGPMIHAEVGDTVVVVLKNNLEAMTVNIEPGGVRYDAITALNPGDVVQSRWYVPASAGPMADSPQSTRAWMYRSTVDVTPDTQAGLVGPLIVASPGTLNEAGRPKDVDVEIVYDLQVFNELASPFYDANVEGKPAVAELGEEELGLATTKHSINGYMFCNMPQVSVGVGQKARWYMLSLGSEDAIHTAHWHGLVLDDDNGRRMDQVVLQSSSLMTLDMIADNPGTWLFHCHLNDHMDGGMMSLFKVTGNRPEPKLDGQTRQYFVSADLVEWDYTPFGGEMCTGTPTNFSGQALTFVERSPERIGRKYMKALYVEYTDGNFTEKKRRAPEWEHLGLLGPVIRGVVGDTIEVTLRNNIPPGVSGPHPISMHPHGVLYTKAGEGSPYNDGTPANDKADDAVPYNGTYKYVWQVPERAGPGEGDMSSIMWMYHSHTLETVDSHAGLFGGIIITRKDLANENATPKDVSREFIVGFTIIDELVSFLLPDNLKKYLPAVAANESAVEALTADPGFMESNLKHTMNGYLYCNMPGLDLESGVTSRFHFLALGGSGDMHTPNSAETQLYMNGHRKQSVQLLPGAMLSVDVTPVVPGPGLLQCHIYDHIAAGMSSVYNVSMQTKPDTRVTGQVRVHYIRAEVVDWDYAPLGKDGCDASDFDEGQEVFVKTTNTTLGSKYKKAVFRAYTDANHTTPIPQPPTNGILGPLLKAEVGDKLVVQFKNELPFAASMQMFGGLIPVGVNQSNAANTGASAGEAEAEAIAKAAGRRLLRQRGGRRLSQITAAQAAAEAEVYDATVSLYVASAIQPGASFRYEWVVPESSGPGPADNGAVAYAYLSGVDNIGHTNAGLVGALLVYDKGGMNSSEVDIELPILFNIQNELQSPFFANNSAAATKAAGLKSIDQTALTFPESNLMHSLNGYVYCNGPTLSLPVNATVRWVVLGFGSEGDMHSPQFEGQDIVYSGSSVYSVGVMPAATYVVDMRATTAGTWEVYCNILDHIDAGMRMRMAIS